MQAEPTAPSADEQLQAELAVAEYVLGWRPKPKDYARITFSGDGRTWTVWNLPAGRSRARQIAVYHVDHPRQPDYGAARRWKERRERVISFQRRVRRNDQLRQRQQLFPAAMRRQTISDIPVPRGQRLDRRLGCGRPPARRRTVSTRAGPSSSDDPHQGDDDEHRPPLREGAAV